MEEQISVDKKTKHILSIVFSIIFAVLNSFGYVFVAIAKTDLKKFNNQYFIIISLILFILIFILIELLRKTLLNIEIIDNCKLIKSDIAFYIILFAISFLLYLLFFIQYFPGLTNYSDTQLQLSQKFHDVPYNEHNPLAHTLYLQFFYYFIGGSLLKNNTLGYGISILVQMLFWIFSLTNVHYLLRKLNIKMIFRAVYFIFTIAMPYFYTHSIYAVKDIICSCFVINYVILLFVEVNFKETFYKSNFIKISYVLCIVGMMLFRSNFKFQFTLIAIIMFIVSRFYINYKKLSNYTMIGFAIGLIILLILKTICNSASGAFGAMKESLVIPIQQIGLAYNQHKDDFTEDEKKYIKESVPQIDAYNTYNADPIKFTVELKKEGYLNRFVGIWFDLFKKYPINYIESPILNALPYLYIFDTYTNDQPFVDVPRLDWFDSREGIDDLKNKNVLFNMLYPDNSKFRENVELFFKKRPYRKIPLINVLMSQALYFYLALYSFLYAIFYKTKTMLPFICFMATVILILFMSPIALIRYILPLILLAYWCN